MAESFVWPEGTLFIYTGNATPSTSAVVAYAQNTRLPLNYGWDNRAAADGTYYDHRTGQRAELSCGAVMTVDSTLAKMFASATAIHAKFINANVIGSAGFWLYSGRIDNLQYQGNEKNPFTYTLNAHFNQWSAF